jgi:hypothetical protein
MGTFSGRFVSRRTVAGIRGLQTMVLSPGVFA